MAKKVHLARRSLRSELRAMAWVSRRELKTLFRYPSWIFVFIALPYMFTAIVSTMGSFAGGIEASKNFAAKTGTENFFIYQIIGSAFWMINILVLSNIGDSLRMEQMRGTLEQNYLTPIRRHIFLIALTIPNLAIALIIFLGVVASSVAIFGLANPISLIQACFILFLGCIPLYGLSFLYAALVVKFKEPWAITNILNTILAIATGTYYPAYLLPKWVQLFSYSIPSTYVIEDLRSILIFNQNLASLWGHILILAAMASLYPWLGYSAYKAFERRARRTGELAKY